MTVPLRLFPLLAGVLALLVVPFVLSSRPAANVTAAIQTSVAAKFPTRPAGDGDDSAIVALGRVEPASRVIRLAGPSGDDAGRIAVLSVAEGQRVTRGQTLGILDTEPRLAAALAQAEANVATKAAQLAQKLAEPDNTDKDRDAAREQRIAGRGCTRWGLDRSSQLDQAGPYSEPALVDERVAPLSEDRKLESSKPALEHVQQRNASGHRLEVAVLCAELRAAEATAEKARGDHAASYFRAPMDGTILRLHARLGQQLGLGGFAEMGGVSTMMVRAEMLEGDIAAIALGQPATVTSRALATSLHGTVDRIGMPLVETPVGTRNIFREDRAAVLGSRIVEVLIKLDPASSARVSGLTNLQVRAAIKRFGPGAGSPRPRLSRLE